jgi:3-(3-hydroxy-phenyl)propionate hydroxylase
MTQPAEHAVVVAGAGPTGMMLAAELTLAGVDVVVVERRATHELDGSRAGGLYPRTIEVLDQRGVAERFVAAGQRHPALSFALVPLDVTDFPTRHNYVLALWQRDFERILAGWVDELGVPILRGRELVGVAQDEQGVDVDVSDGASLRAQYVVGCDGGRSVVRKTAGIDFPGWDATASWMIAELEMDDEPETGARPEGGGIGPVNRVEGGGPYRVALRETGVGTGDEPTLEDLRELLVGIYGTDFGAHSPTWISRFTDTTRQAASYRAGRVLLAGDAAHVHPPHGGQGLNTGVQDAVNLGWKLAQVVDGTSPEKLLDTYHAERHPVGARVLQNTMAMVALSSADARHEALRDVVGELLRMEEPRRRVAGTVSGLDIRYNIGAEGEGGGRHPLVGRRMPDLDLRTTTGPTRVYALLHDARPLLLHFGPPAAFDLPERARLVAAEPDDRWELPVVGEVTAPAAVLVRPDGHVAWAGDPTDGSMSRAAAAWFGGGSTDQQSGKRPKSGCCGSTRASRSNT